MSEKYGILQYLDLNQNNYKVTSNQKYDQIKDFNGKKYSGMSVGGSHYWSYDNGKWFETKKSPEQWKFTFNSIKNRYHNAPKNTGAKVNTKYHWYIIADQIATKLNANQYMTTMKGFKFKIGHKRPNWKKFTYEYPEQQTYKQKIIEILENTLVELKSE